MLYFATESSWGDHYRQNLCFSLSGKMTEAASRWGRKGACLSKVTSPPLKDLVAISSTKELARPTGPKIGASSLAALAENR